MTTRTGSYIGDLPALAVANVSRRGYVAVGATLSLTVNGLNWRYGVLEATQNVAVHARVLLRDINTGLGIALTSSIVSTLTFQICKSGASSFSTITPVTTILGNGVLDVLLTAGNVDTLGLMNLHIEGPNIIPNDDVDVNVIALNKADGVRAGLSALPNVAAGSLGGLPTSAVRTATAQGAGNGVNQIVLDAGASSVDGFYSRQTISIISGTGAGQSRSIASYVGSTRTASLNKNWSTQPDNTSVFEIVSSSNSLLTEGLAQGGTANTITFRANDSAQDDLYRDEWVQITSGTGAGQSRLITGYVGATKVVTVDKNWKINPDATSVYQIMTGATVAVSAVTGVALTTDVTAATATLAADITASTATLAADITASTATLAADITASTATILAAVPSAATIRDAILNAARSGHLTAGTIGEGIALATALLQGNFYIDNVVNTDPNGPTAQRLRCFVSAAAMAGATYGGSGQGEFASFAVTTTYDGPNKIHDHKVVQL